MNDYKVLMIEQARRRDMERERHQDELRREALLAKAASPAQFRRDWWKTLLAHLRLPTGPADTTELYPPPHRLMLDTGECGPTKSASTR